MIFLLYFMYNLHCMEIFQEIYNAIRNNDLDLLQSLVNTVNNIEDFKKTHDFFGRSPLHMAIQSGHLPIVKWLISIGFCINSKDFYYGQTGLHYAVKYGHLEIVKWLIDNGADIDAKDKSWLIPDYMNNSDNKQIIKLFLLNYRNK
jgi:ankyrin repeat protein